MAIFELIHGAWHDGRSWDLVCAELRGRGHVALAPDLPLDDPHAGYEERVRPAMDALEGVSGPVVVVGHSMGSAYAPLVAARRPGSLLVHLCPSLSPFTPPPGAPAKFRAGFPFPAERPDGTSAWDPAVAIEAIYGRLPRATAEDLAQRLGPMAAPPDDFPLAVHPDVPTALIYAAEDEFFEPAWERHMAQALLNIDPIELPGGHFPMIEDPVALADLLERLGHEHAGDPA